MGPRPPADTTPPQVSITAPANNSTVSGSISIQATATDNKGISKVEFYVDNALKATSYGLPYAYSWNSAAVVNGSHALKVVAFDASKNTKQAQASVTVNNTVPPPPIFEGEQIKVPSAVVSSYYNSSKAAAQTIDNNLSTYWEGKYRVSWFSSKTITSWWLRL
ncbi:MAG: Ig-like domain-containing protein, partial [Candidatus Omnitrophota bacterium]|nr:Ig-like domain-containing protein [Candidatus Omnitrophota bacterium]